MPNIKQHGESHEQEHLTKEGEPDHRYKENRDDQQQQQQSGNDEEEHLTKEGEPDRRYKENRDDQQQQSGNKGQEHRTKEGGSDRRQKENRDNQRQQSNKEDDDDDDPSKLADIPTKSDGTADMRYKESREAVSSGLISEDEIIEDAMNGDHHQKQDDKNSKQ